MNKILILGSNSFAGSHLVNDSLDKNFKVVGISRSKNLYNPLQPYFKNKNINNFKFYKLDLNKDLYSIIALIKKFKPEYIVDFAGQGMIAPSFDFPEHWYQTNVLSKIKLYNSLARFNFIKKYIKISTPEVYGSTRKKISENDYYNPTTPYAASHAAIDTYLRILNLNYDFPSIITRFSNFYGPHQQNYRLIPNLIIKILTKKLFILEGKGNSIRSFIYASDITNALFKVIKKGKNGEIYHFSGSDFYTIRSIIEKICTSMNVNFNDYIKVGKTRIGLDHSYFMKSQKSKQKLNWSTKISLNSGLLKTIAYFDKNINLINKKPSHYIHKK